MANKHNIITASELKQYNYHFNKVEWHKNTFIVYFRSKNHDATLIHH